MSSGTCAFTSGKACLMNGKMSFFSVFLLHGFKFISVAGFPIQVIEGKYQYPDRKRNDGEMFESISAE